MENNVIVFDFDGVIVDSAYECYLASLKAFKNISGHLKDTEKIKKEFFAARPFVRMAEDFYPILKVLEKEPKKDFSKITLDEFKKLRKRYGNGSEEFGKMFYSVREIMQKEDTERWFNLHNPRPGVLDAINLLSKKYRIFIATAKDRESTFRLLKHFGVNIKKDTIVSKEISKNKLDQIRFISKEYRILHKDILFIEDVLENLMPLRKLKIRIALTSWGYSTKETIKEAKKLKIPIIKPNKVAEQIERLI